MYMPKYQIRILQRGFYEKRLTMVIPFKDESLENIVYNTFLYSTNRLVALGVK